MLRRKGGDARGSSGRNGRRNAADIVPRRSGESQSLARLAELAPLLPPYAHTASALPCPAAGMAAAAAALKEFTDAQIRTLSSRLAEPGLDALFKAARREAQRVGRRPPTREQLRAAVATVSTRQV